MPAPVIFKDLPATFPGKDKYRKPSVISSLIFHGFLVAIVVIIPLLAPQSLSKRVLLVTLVAPLAPPPPAAPPPPPQQPRVVQPKAMKPVNRPVAPEALIVPTVVPKDVANIVDIPVGGEAIGAVAGNVGTGGGTAGGVLGGMFSSNSESSVPPAIAPPPPPPPPPPAPKAAAPSGPIRVGGVVKEPRALKVVAPRYPALASRARVSGTVMLEATLTADGMVSEVRVLSGHPLLVEAAVDCVKQWRYEPTMLNGVPVAIILTAKVSFERSQVS